MTTIHNALRHHLETHPDLRSVPQVEATSLELEDVWGEEPCGKIIHILRHDPEQAPKRRGRPPGKHNLHKPRAATPAKITVADIW